MNANDYRATMLNVLKRHVLVGILAGLCGLAGIAFSQSLPRISEADLSTGQMQPVDLEALAQRYEAVAAAARTNGTEEGKVPSGLFVFVSFGMPKEALQKIVVQAERVNATLVLRGLVERSIPKTAAAAKEMLGSHKVGWMIDPRLFKLYQVSQVPATVLVLPGTAAQFCEDKKCANLPEYLKVSGDVSIRYALETMGHGRSSELAALATTYVERFDEFRGQQ